MPDRARVLAAKHKAREQHAQECKRKRREKYMTSRNGVQTSEQQEALAPTVLFSLQTFGSALFLLVVAALPCVDGHTHLLGPASAVLVNTYIPT